MNENDGQPARPAPAPMRPGQDRCPYCGCVNGHRCGDARCGWYRGCKR